MAKKYIIISLIVLMVIALIIVLYFVGKGRLSSPKNKSAAAPSATAPQSLGGQIYNQASNPLSNKLPDTNPVKNANPVQGLKINPF